MKTVTVCVVLLATAGTSVPSNVAVNCVEEMNCVDRDAPSMRTTELPTKPVPFTVSVTGVPAPTIVDGEIVVIAGTGLVVTTVTVALESAIVAN